MLATPLTFHASILTYCAPFLGLYITLMIVILRALALYVPPLSPCNGSSQVISHAIFDARLIISHDELSDDTAMHFIKYGQPYIKISPNRL